MARSSDRWCKHYAGFYEKTHCRAGVEYAALAALDAQKRPPFHALPCLGEAVDPVPCEKCERKTPEEIAARDAEIAKRMEAMGKARAAIVAHLGGPWKKGATGAGGIIDCPTCGKKLKFSRSGYNGHIHAACETEGCTAWME